MSAFTDTVLKRLAASNTMRHLFDNQMRIVQTRALAGGSGPEAGKTVIRVPYESPATQWKLVGLPELDTKKENTQEWSYYDGYQLYADEPMLKTFRQEWVEGPLYTQDGFRDDQTFTFNLVDSKGATKHSSGSERELPASAGHTPGYSASPSLVSDDDEDQSTDEDSA